MVSYDLYNVRTTDPIRQLRFCKYQDDELMLAIDVSEKNWKMKSHQKNEVNGRL